MRTPAYLTGVTERRNNPKPEPVKDADIKRAEAPRSMSGKTLDGWAHYCGEDAASWVRRAATKAKQGKTELSDYCDEQAAESASKAAHYGRLALGQ